MLTGSRKIRSAVAIVVIAQFVLSLSGCGTTSSTQTSGVKNVILVVGDGMQLEHERAANNYLFGNYTDGLAFWKFPYQGQSTTWDVTTYNKYATVAGKSLWSAAASSAEDATTFDALMGYDPSKGGNLPWPLDTSGDKTYLLTAATDSASAGTALATGYKTDDGNVAWKTGDPENGRLQTIAEMYRYQKKAAIGVVTTVPFTHATPATFVSHNKSRNNYKDIGYEIINSVKPEVVIGGGNPNYTTSYMDTLDYTILKNSTEYVLAERQTGVDGNATIAAKAAEAVAGGKKLFGLFGNSGGQFDYNVPSNTAGAPSVTRGSIENPSLAEASKAALKVLSQNKNGFFLMVEQGDIDWANHANDFKSMVGGVYDLNETIKAIETYVDQPGDSVDWNNTLVIVTSDHGNSYMRLDSTKPLQKGELPQQDANSVAVGSYTPGYVYPNGEVSYSTGGHTNEMTRVYAKGAGTNLLSASEGSWYSGTKIIDNTQIFRAMLNSLGLTDQNKQGSMASMVGRFVTGTYGTSAAEIVAFHPSSKTAYVINGAANRLEILDASTLGTSAIANPLTASNLTGTQMAFPATTTVKVAGVDTVVNTGGGPNSIAVYGDLLAIAVGASPKTDKGVVMFYDIAGYKARSPHFIKAVQVGSLPDMVTFTPDGSKVVVADEGEPSDDYLTDPEGTVAIIDVTGGQPADTATIADFSAFDAQKTTLAAAGVKFASPVSTTVSQDLEPEYVAISDDSKTAYVTLQENNAIAVVNLTTKTVTSIKPLGFKDYSLAKNALDVTDKDSVGKFITVPGLYGMYQPDSIATYTSGGATYLVTANEGDTRDYSGYSEEVRVKDIYGSLDPVLQTAYAAAGGDSGLGRLKVTTAMGLNAATGLYDKLFAFGGRSFSIWDSNGTLVYDSGSLMERMTSALFGSKYNNNSTENKGDSRSDDKGPEPEALAIGQVGTRTYAFVGLERMGGFFIFDITIPTAPEFVEHVLNRDLSAVFTIDDTGAAAHTGAYATAGDLAPEGMKFVPATASPTGKALLVIGNETSGTVSIYQINER
ncbi:MAG: choice-of-anchor I family protein [Desulfuromonadaceae bacterium]|nr:choice-of-anchor I family protein [Desulfuromonadaceae bacterium]MDD2848883.1 choice-of-anchor I family protein [Desulfuromonadaceae bacterium]MDD4132160.1 choice-of-anchor I family protein [Desulfuromonadaceae bacterium]